MTWRQLAKPQPLGGAKGRLWPALSLSVLLGDLNWLYCFTRNLCARIHELTSPIAPHAEVFASFFGRNLLLWSARASVVLVASAVPATAEKGFRQ